MLLDCGEGRFVGEIAWWGVYLKGNNEMQGSSKRRGSD